VTAAHLVFFALYLGLGIVMVQATFKRRAAIQAWRESAKGEFDPVQRRFVTDIDLDRAALPPQARKLLLESRRDIAIATGAVLVLLCVQLFLMVS
jgi:hypothetical protein